MMCCLQISLAGLQEPCSKETKCTEVKDLSKKCIWESGILVTLGLEKVKRTSDNLV